MAPDAHPAPPVPIRSTFVSSDVSAVPTACALSAPPARVPRPPVDPGRVNGERAPGAELAAAGARVPPWPRRAADHPRGQKWRDTEGAAPGRSTAATHLGDRQRAGPDLRRGCESGDRARRAVVDYRSHRGNGVRARTWRGNFGRFPKRRLTDDRVTVMFPCLGFWGTVCAAGVEIPSLRGTRDGRGQGRGPERFARVRVATSTSTATAPSCSGARRVTAPPSPSSTPSTTTGCTASACAGSSTATRPRRSPRRPSSGPGGRCPGSPAACASTRG